MRNTRQFTHLLLVCYALSYAVAGASAQAPVGVTGNPAVDPASAPDREGADDPGFTLNVNVDLVELQVLAVDREGRHVSTLSEGDFVIYEDQVEQQISLFRRNDLPVSLGLVIDNSRSMTRKKDRVDVAALSFVNHNNPDDESFLIHFDDTARLVQGLTKDVGAIRRALATIQPYGQTALFDAVGMALETIEAGEHMHRAILVITDGADNASRSTFGDVLERVRQSDVTLYTIGVFRNPQEEAEARPVLEALAGAGGGRAFFPTDPVEVPALTLQIAQEIRDQYTLGYVPANFRHDGTWRGVRVQVRPEAGGRNIQLNYRHGYYAPEE